MSLFSPYKPHESGWSGTHGLGDTANGLGAVVRVWRHRLAGRQQVEVYIEGL